MLFLAIVDAAESLRESNFLLPLSMREAQRRYPHHAGMVEKFLGLSLGC